jgi:Cu/Ag efflux protein CusF
VPKNFNSGQLAPAPTPLKTPFVPRNGDYKGRGKVTRIETTGGSIEIDHEDIPDLMPAKKTEVVVSDKSMLNGLKLGDTVSFTLRYNSGQETIVAISKIQ